jgi:hypothetical protein
LYSADCSSDGALTESLLLRKRWLHRLGERWASDTFTTREQYASAEDDALTTSAILVPDPAMADLPRLRIEDMQDLIAFEDDDNNEDMQENEMQNFPGVLKVEPKLEESLFDDQIREDDNREARAAMEQSAPPTWDFDYKSDSEIDGFHSDNDLISRESEEMKSEFAFENDPWVMSQTRHMQSPTSA